MMGGIGAPSIKIAFSSEVDPGSREENASKKSQARQRAYSQAQTSATLAAQATSRATMSVSWTRSQEGVWRIVLMAETSGDSA